MTTHTQTVEDVFRVKEKLGGVGNGLGGLEMFGACLRRGGENRVPS